MPMLHYMKDLIILISYHTDTIDWKDAQSDENQCLTSGFREREENLFKSSIRLRLNA